MGLFSADGAYDRLQKLIRKIKPYRVYEGLLTQAGTAIPTCDVLTNELGTITFSRSGFGVYLVTGDFPNLKTSCVITANALGATPISKISTTQFRFTTLDNTGTAADDLLANTTILIKVYY